MKFRFLTLIMLSVAVTAATAAAQESPSSNGAPLARFEREREQLQRDTSLLVNPSVSVGQRALFDYGGYATASYLSLDDPSGHNHGLRQYDLVGYGRVDIDDVHEFFVRGRMSYLDFNPNDDFDPDQAAFRPRLERAYYKFDLAKAFAAYKGEKIDDDISFEGGRQLAYWGTGLVLSQTIDGAIVDLVHKSFDLQVLAGVTPQESVDIDFSRPLFDRETHRGFYGAIFSAQLGTHKPFIYLMAQQDYNHDTPSVTGPITTHFNYNSYYAGIGSTGSIDDKLSYAAEVVYEGGDGLSNSFTTAGGSFAQAVQRDQEIHAWALDFRLDYALPDSRRTRFTGELIASSGDNDRRNATNTFGGNTANTSDHSFIGFGQVNNGVAFAPAISNVYVMRFGASTFPLGTTSAFKNLQLGTDLFCFAKVSNRAPIDEATFSKGFLGFEPDIFINWPIVSDVTLAMRYGAFVPGIAIPGNSVRQFFYAGVTFAF